MNFYLVQSAIVRVYTPVTYKIEVCILINYSSFPRPEQQFPEEVEQEPDKLPSLSEDDLEKAIQSIKDKVDEMKNDLRIELQVSLRVPSYIIFVFRHWNQSTDLYQIYWKLESYSRINKRIKEYLNSPICQSQQAPGIMQRCSFIC